jgi:peptide deformylase
VDASSLEVVNYPDPVLRKTARPVTEIDDALVAISERMLELMVEHKGVGLAGPQVALSTRLFVMNPTGEPEDNRVVINPQVLARRGRESMTEGCLSLPDIQGKIERPTWIRWRYFDLDGGEVTEELSGFPARVAQHEIDHLDGILITDRMRPAERSVAERQLRDLEERYARRKAQEADGDDDDDDDEVAEAEVESEEADVALAGADDA